MNNEQLTMKNEQLKTKDITARTYRFALEIVKLTNALPKETVSMVLGKQLVASGTSIAANIEEAQGAFSKDDFVYKMQTAFKESLETNLWLRLIRDAGIVFEKRVESLLKESEEIKRILSSIVKSSKRS